MMRCLRTPILIAFGNGGDLTGMELSGYERRGGKSGRSRLCRRMWTGAPTGTVQTGGMAGGVVSGGVALWLCANEIHHTHSHRCGISVGKAVANG